MGGAQTSALAAAASALTAINSPSTSATSATSLTVGAGNQSPVIQAGKALVVGQTVVIARTADPANTWMYGSITAYNSGTGALTVAVSTTSGGGSFTDWTISLTGVLVPALKETKTAPAINAGVLPINCAAGNAFATILNASITSFTVTNIPASGTFYGFVLELTADGTARTVTWSFQGVAVKWASATAPVLTSAAGKKDAYVFYTHDAGVAWLGSVCGRNF